MRKHLQGYNPVSLFMFMENCMIYVILVLMVLNLLIAVHYQIKNEYDKATYHMVIGTSFLLLGANRYA